MDSATLAEVMGNVPGVNYEALTGPFNQAMLEADVTTPLRAAHWCAQLGHESGGLKWLTEIADGSAYDGRTDIGNIYPGDGPRFRGRSPIQITGRSNYTSLSAWAFDKGLVPTKTFFVDQPEQLATPAYTFLGPVWYWTVARDLNPYADRDDANGLTYKINGGYRGLDDRNARLEKAKRMGSRLLPEKGTVMAKVFDVDLSDRFGFGGPRSTSGLQRVVIHTTENDFGTPAENVANYQINSETGSYHYLVGSDGLRVRCNTDDWVTWSTGNDEGNVQGLNLSFVARAAVSRSEWLAQEKMLRAGASVVADWCTKYGIPVVKVTTARGICGHGDLRVFGGTDHTDPGNNFPWDVFINYVKEAQSGSSAPDKEAPVGSITEKLIGFIIDQFAGPEREANGLPKFTGWPQLGKKTLVDAVAEVRTTIFEIRSDIKQILEIMKKEK